MSVSGAQSHPLSYRRGMEEGSDPMRCDWAHSRGDPLRKKTHPTAPVIKGLGTETKHSSDSIKNF